MLAPSGRSVHSLPLNVFFNVHLMYNNLYSDSENPENENQEAIKDKLQEYTEKYAKNDFEFDEFDDERSDVSDDSDNEDLDD